MVATGSDGASVNLGKRHSVTAILNADVESLIIMHCINHRIELGVLDAMKLRDIPEFKKMKDILMMVHKHYHFSAKAVRGLREISEAMGEK